MTGTDVLGFYRNRMLRLFPAYLATMALFALFGRGSASTAWSNLLYVNNFIPTYDQFMLHAWSLAVEAQFYLLFPLLLLLVKNPGRRFWIGLIVLGLAVRALVIVRNEVWAHTAASPVIDRDACAYFNDVLYDKFYTRYGALVCGVLAAQEYMTGAARRFFQRRIAPYACLVVSLVVTAILCSPPPVASGAGPSAIEVSIFLVLYQTLFAGAVAFVMLAVLVGWKPLQPLASFLSWRGFFPLAQLSYGAYLLHPLVIEQTYLLAPPSAASPALLLGYFAAFLLGAFALAIPLHLFVEAPGMRLRRPFAARQVAASGATS